MQTLPQNLGYNYLMSQSNFYIISQCVIANISTLWALGRYKFAHAEQSAHFGVI